MRESSTSSDQLDRIFEEVTAPSKVDEASRYFLHVVREHWKIGLVGALGGGALCLAVLCTKSYEYQADAWFRLAPERVQGQEESGIPDGGVLLRESELPEMTLLGDEVLRRVHARYQHAGRWLKVDAPTFAAQTRDRVSLREQINGEMRMVGTGSTSAGAAELVNLILITYQEGLEEEERAFRRNEVDTLRSTVADQELQLEETEAAIQRLREKNLEFTERYGGPGRGDWRHRLKLQQVSTQLGKLEEDLEAIQELDLDDFLHESNERGLLEGALLDLSTQYFDQLGSVRALNHSGLSSSHTEVLASRRRYELIRRQLEEQAEEFRALLREERESVATTQTELVRDREKLWNGLEALRERETLARARFETISEALSDLRVRQLAAELRMSLPIRVMDHRTFALPPEKQDLSQVAQDLALAPLLGLATGLLSLFGAGWRGKLLPTEVPDSEEFGEADLRKVSPTTEEKAGQENEDVVLVG
ncbi:MAG: hypothetical protein AAF191_05535 [Verrucomicrobiota bacterium]